MHFIREKGIYFFFSISSSDSEGLISSLTCSDFLCQLQYLNSETNGDTLLQALCPPIECQASLILTDAAPASYNGPNQTSLLQAASPMLESFKFAQEPAFLQEDGLIFAAATSALQFDITSEDMGAILAVCSGLKAEMERHFRVTLPPRSYPEGHSHSIVQVGIRFRVETSGAAILFSSFGAAADINPDHYLAEFCQSGKESECVAGVLQLEIQIRPQEEHEIALGISIEKPFLVMAPISFSTPVISVNTRPSRHSASPFEARSSESGFLAKAATLLSPRTPDASSFQRRYAPDQQAHQECFATFMDLSIVVSSSKISSPSPVAEILAASHGQGSSQKCIRVNIALQNLEVGLTGKTLEDLLRFMGSMTSLQLVKKHPTYPTHFPIQSSNLQLAFEMLHFRGSVPYLLTAPDDRDTQSEFKAAVEGASLLLDLRTKGVSSSFYSIYNVHDECVLQEFKHAQLKICTAAPETQKIYQSCTSE